MARSADGGLSAINLNAADMNFRDCYAGKTAMVRATDNVDGIGAYVVGSGALGGTSVIAHCYLYYGSKHILGLVASAHDSDVTIQDVQAEQCPPGVSSSVWVSFMDGLHGESNNVHRYIRCRTDWPIGKIGSTAGDTTIQSVMLMHNSSSGVQFRDAIFDHCTINGYVALGICSNAIMQDCVVGGFAPSAVVSNICVRTRFSGTGLNLEFSSATSTLVRNCIAVHTNLYAGGIWTGWTLQGNVTLENCTLDFTRVRPVSAGLTSGTLNRRGPLNLVARNNVFLMNPPGGTNQFAVFANFTTNDTYAISNNVFVLGSSNWVASAYTNAASGADKTFAQWQALGFDANSRLVNDARIDPITFNPLNDSPVRDFAVSLDRADEFTVEIFEDRNDAGAIEFVDRFQGITGLMARPTVSGGTSVHSVALSWHFPGPLTPDLDYRVFASSNLTTWTCIATSRTESLVFDATNFPARFFVITARFLGIENPDPGKLGTNIFE